MEDSNPNPPVQPLVNGVSPNNTAGHASQESPKFPQPSPQVVPPPKHETESYYARPDPTPLWKIILEVVVGSAVIAYTIVASLQLRTMNKTYEEIAKQTPQLTAAATTASDSAKLNRQLAEGTQAAAVTADVSISSDSNSVDLLIRNFGHVTANDVTANVVVTKERLPDTKQMGEKIHYSIGPLPLPPWTVGESDKGQIFRTFPIPGFEWDAALQLEQTISIEWNGSYENGFGRTTPIAPMGGGKTGCQVLWFKDFTVRNGRIEADFKTTIPCAEFDSKKIAQSRESRRKAEEGAKGQIPK